MEEKNNGKQIKQTPREKRKIKNKKRDTLREETSLRVRKLKENGKDKERKARK